MADLSGRGSVIAARMAVEDFGADAKGMKVEIVGAHHQNKPDVGSRWHLISSAQLRIRLAAVKSSSALLYSGTISYSAQRDISSSRLSHWMASSSSLVNSAKHLGLPICVTDCG